MILTWQHTVAQFRVRGFGAKPTEVIGALSHRALAGMDLMSLRTMIPYRDICLRCGQLRHILKRCELFGVAADMAGPTGDCKV